LACVAYAMKDFGINGDKSRALRELLYESESLVDDKSGLRFVHASLHDYLASRCYISMREDVDNGIRTEWRDYINPLPDRTKYFASPVFPNCFVVDGGSWWSYSQFHALSVWAHRMRQANIGGNGKLRRAAYYEMNTKNWKAFEPAVKDRLISVLNEVEDTTSIGLLLHAAQSEAYDGSRRAKIFETIGKIYSGLAERQDIHILCDSASNQEFSALVERIVLEPPASNLSGSDADRRKQTERNILTALQRDCLESEGPARIGGMRLLGVLEYRFNKRGVNVGSFWKDACQSLLQSTDGPDLITMVYNIIDLDIFANLPRELRELIGNIAERCLLNSDTDDKRSIALRVLVKLVGIREVYRFLTRNLWKDRATWMEIIAESSRLDHENTTRVITEHFSGDPEGMSVLRQLNEYGAHAWLMLT
jgi:hypothetical protein